MTARADTLVIALGGNALEDRAAPGPTGETRAARAALSRLAPAIAGRHRVVITHGNGPQVGDLYLRSEWSSACGVLHPLPLGTCVADTAGGLGSLLARELGNALRAVGCSRPVATLLTTVVVEAKEISSAPRKPIGHPVDQRWISVLDRPPVRSRATGCDQMTVPSPPPRAVLEIEAIRLLVDAGVVVVAGGGGGAPVVERPSDGRLDSVDVVLDKDAVASLLANALDAATLVILTDVDRAYADFASPSQRALGRVSVGLLRRFLDAGHFGEGTMRPKIEALLEFVEAGGKRAALGHIMDAAGVVAGSAGTQVERAGGSP